jgi:hypothetical protein
MPHCNKSLIFYSQWMGAYYQPIEGDTNMAETYTAAFKKFVGVYFGHRGMHPENITVSQKHDTVKLEYQGGIGASDRFGTMASQLASSGITDVSTKDGILTVTLPADAQAIERLHEAAHYAGQAEAEKRIREAVADATEMLTHSEGSPAAAKQIIADILEGFQKPRPIKSTTTTVGRSR